MYEIVNLWTEKPVYFAINNEIGLEILEENWKNTYS